VQIVGYDVGVGEADPALLLAADGTVEPEPLRPGRRLHYALGRRRCAGAVDGTEHRSCERSAVPRCPRHETTWICARCTGTCLKAEMDCHREHAVYVAAFAPATFKVGVTGRSDPEIRLREQGADRGAVIRRVENGRIAREIESKIASETALVDSVRVPTKIAGMGRSVDEAAWERRLSAFDVERRYDLEYGFELSSSARRGGCSSSNAAASASPSICARWSATRSRRAAPTGGFRRASVRSGDPEPGDFFVVSRKGGL
jgi:hypothetical protein